MDDVAGNPGEPTITLRTICADACKGCADAEALRRDRAKLEAAQALAHVGCWEIELRTPARFADRKVCSSSELLRILDREPGARLTSADVLACVHPEDRELVGQAFRAALSVDRAPFECRIVRRDGEVRFLRTHLEVQRDSVGRVELLRGATFDATEAQRAQEAVLAHNAHMMMADRLASVGQLAAGVAHEINNLLACVRGNVEVAMHELAALVSPASVVEPLQDALSASDRIQQIVRDLKLFSRADEDDRALVDVPQAVSSTLRLAAKQLGGRARLVTDLQPVPAIEANQARLGQVVLNLVVNAIQSIPEGSAAHATIRVSTRWTGTHIVIAVADTGCGIPEAARPRLFEPFFTTKPTGVGTGLGLPICQQIVHNLGGTIEYTTELGRGTEFRVLLPAGDPRRARSSTRPAVAPAPPPRRAPHRLLIIDDEPLIARAAQRALRDYDVTVAASATEAIPLLASGARFDLVLCDLMMPGMNGIELYERMRRDAPHCADRMRFMTGGAFTDQAAEFLARMAGRYVEKPFSYQTLRTVIDGWCAAEPPLAQAVHEVMA